MKTYSRWHRFDNNGVKYIKKYPLDEIPNPLSEEGYTDWTRGTGPHNEATMVKIRAAIDRICKGVPKTPEQKYKMRLAKLGKPKTEQHKLNIKLAHQRRKLRKVNEGKKVKNNN